MESIEAVDGHISRGFVKVANSPRLLLLLSVAILSAASITYMISERVSALNAFYWSFVTATTLGYGDLAPHGTVSKVTAVALVASTVVFFIPMVTASIASKLIVNRDAFTHEEQEEMKQLLREVHATLGARNSGEHPTS